MEISHPFPYLSGLIQWNSGHQNFYFCIFCLVSAEDTLISATFNLIVWKWFWCVNTLVLLEPAKKAVSEHLMQGEAQYAFCVRKESHFPNYGNPWFSRQCFDFQKLVKSVLSTNSLSKYWKILFKVVTQWQSICLSMKSCKRQKSYPWVKKIPSSRYNNPLTILA